MNRLERELASRHSPIVDTVAKSAKHLKVEGLRIQGSSKGLVCDFSTGFVPEARESRGLVVVVAWSLEKR
jgi:hypothetical protein